jgi:hypothetical protein
MKSAMIAMVSPPALITLLLRQALLADESLKFRFLGV